MVKKTKDKTKKDKGESKNTRKPARSPSQILRDRKRIASMYLRGEHQADIARVLKISQSTVSIDLAELQSEWKKSSLMDFNERKAIELAKIDSLEVEYWDAWNRSREYHEIKTVSSGTRQGLSFDEETIRQEDEPIGDKKFLDGVQWCINKRCEILGLDAPKKQSIFEINKSTPRPIIRRVAAGMTVEEAYAEFISGKNADIYGNS